MSLGLVVEKLYKKGEAPCEYMAGTQAGALRAVVIYKESEYAKYKVLASKSPEYARYLASGFKRVERMKDSDKAQKEALKRVEADLKSLGIRYYATSVSQASMFMPDFKEHYDLIIAVGGDGTFLQAAKYTAGKPILGVNSDPNPGGSKGFYCASDAANFRQLMQSLGSAPRTQLNTLEVIVRHESPQLSIFDGRTLALNDVFIGLERRNATAMLSVDVDGKKIEYRGSGVLVSGPGGSTAWIDKRGGKIRDPADKKVQYLLEDYPARPRLANAVKIVSHTPNVKLFIDSDHDPVHFGLGGEVTIRVGPPVTVIGDLRQKQKEHSQKTGSN